MKSEVSQAVSRWHVAWAVFLGAVLAELMLIPAFSRHPTETRLLIPATIADVSLFIILSAVLWRYSRRAFKWTWSALPRLLLPGVLGMAGVTWIAEKVGMSSAVDFRAVLAVGELTMFTVLLIACIRALRTGQSFSDTINRAISSLPPPAQGLVRTELGIFIELARVLLRRRAATPVPSAEVFPAMAASQSGWFIPFVIIATLVEMTAIHVLLMIFMPDQLWAHFLLIFLNAYSILWLCADWAAMKASAHRLEVNGLRLHLGSRFQAEIPYGHIERVLRLSTHAERQAVQGKNRKNPQVTPLDEPNIHLCLKESCEYTTVFGLRRSTAHLDLFVDRPEEFVTELTAILPQESMSAHETNKGK